MALLRIVIEMIINSIVLHACILCIGAILLKPIQYMRDTVKGNCSKGLSKDELPESTSRIASLHLKVMMVPRHIPNRFSKMRAPSSRIPECMNSFVIHCWMPFTCAAVS